VNTLQSQLFGYLEYPNVIQKASNTQETLKFCFDLGIVLLKNSTLKRRSRFSFTLKSHYKKTPLLEDVA
jgi:hypothetical protein